MEKLDKSGLGEHVDKLSISRDDRDSVKTWFSCHQLEREMQRVSAGHRLECVLSGQRRLHDIVHCDVLELVGVLHMFPEVFYCRKLLLAKEVEDETGDIVKINDPIILVRAFQENRNRMEVVTDQSFPYIDQLVVSLANEDFVSLCLQSVDRDAVDLLEEARRKAVVLVFFSLLSQNFQVQLQIF